MDIPATQWYCPPALVISIQHPTMLNLRWIRRQELGQRNRNAHGTYPGRHDTCSLASIQTEAGSLPQTTLGPPPEVILRDRLADSAVHDYKISSTSGSVKTAYIHNSKRQTQHRHHGEIPLQLRLMPHARQLDVIVVNGLVFQIVRHGDSTYVM